MIREYPCPAERFQRDVATHEMTVLRDDGVSRHLQFKRPGDSSYWFDVITWDGRLYIGGDCGAFVFTRLHDMFEFFRGDEVRINPPYWAEKLVASERDGFEKFSWDKFEADVKDYFDQHWATEIPGEDADDNDRAEYVDHCAKRDECWVEVREAMNEPDEYGAVAFIRDFEHDGFYFEDWERTSMEYTFRFIWNCRAIVWAIDKYDASKVTTPATEASSS